MNIYQRLKVLIFGKERWRVVDIKLVKCGDLVLYENGCLLRVNRKKYRAYYYNVSGALGAYRRT